MTLGHLRHTGTQGHLGTRTLKALGHSGTRKARGHLGTQALGHSRHLSHFI